MTPTASALRHYLAQRGISARAVAARLGLHPGHLQRVLNGERSGSRALLESVAEIARSMPSDRDERPDDIERLIDAATHVFFLKRGNFASAICTRPTRSKTKE